MCTCTLNSLCAQRFSYNGVMEKDFISEINAASSSFDFLEDEPEIYSIEDLKPVALQSS